MSKNDKNHQMHEKEYWDKLAVETKDEIKCARVLPEDTPEFIVKWSSGFEIDVAKFCFDGYSGLMLDAGCGNGNILMHALNSFSKININYVGLDFSREMLKKAVARVKEKSKVSFFQGSITNLPFKDNAFDHVLSSGVITYLGYRDEAEKPINEFYRVLKPEGILLIDFFNRFSPKIIAKSIVLRRDLPKSPKIIAPFWLVKKLKEIGFDILTYRGYDFRPISGNQSYRTILKYFNPGFMQEKFSSFIEKTVVPHIPLMSLFGYRIYVKCRK